MWIRAFFTLSHSMHDNSVHCESLLQMLEKIIENNPARDSSNVTEFTLTDKNVSQPIKLPHKLC